MSATYDLFVVGRPSVDLMFRGLPEWPALGKDIEVEGLGVCAGTTFNTPAAANRIGLRVAYVASLGTDDFSGIILREWEAEGLPAGFLEVDERPLPGISVALNMRGDRGFVSYWGGGQVYDDALDARGLEVAARVDARHAHLYADSAPELEEVVRSRGMTVSLDAFDGASWSSPRSAAHVLRGADVLFANETEACAMAEESDPVRALECLHRYCPTVVMKQGAAGAMAITEGRIAAVPAEPVEVVDTTGAGDAFNAGFLAGWLDGLPIKDSLTLGVLCGSRAVTDYGGYRGCPREEEFRALAASHGIAVRERSST